MDNKAFIQQLSAELQCVPDDASAMVAALASVLRERAANLDSIAIPGFGNFVAIKQSERVVADGAGRHMLVPPQIKIEFVASAMLKKQLTNE